MSVLETQFSGDTILLVFPDGTSPALLMCLIAGIPLNRVHEFNFEPGEIRYDVNMETVLGTKLTEEKHNEYVMAIERGREKLKNARDNPSQFVDILEEEKIYYQTITRTNNHEKQMNKSGMGPLLGFGLFYALVSNQLKAMESEDDNKEDDVVKMGDNEKVHDDYDAPELMKMEKLVTNAPFDIPEMNQNDNDIDERIELANLAMEEYLDKDDGGEDWIGFMNDLMYEEGKKDYDQNSCSNFD